MIVQYPYAIYLDSKIIGSAIQMIKFFDQNVFQKSNTIIYLKKYKESSQIFSKLFNDRGIKYLFLKNTEMDQLENQIIFYAFNAQSNCRLVANRKLKHVFMTHGESNKISSIKPIIRIYDHVIMTGNLSLERYYKSGLFDEHDLETGRLIMMGDTFIGKTGFSQDENKEPIIFYAPTWEGGTKSENYSSLENVKLVKDCIIQALSEFKLNKVIMQPHPNIGHRDKNSINNLINIMKELQKYSIEIYLYQNDARFNFIEKIKTRKIKRIAFNDLGKFQVKHAFVDISAIESQCINENINYTLLYKKDLLRKDIPDLYLEKYRKSGVKIGSQSKKIDFKEENYERDIIYNQLFGYHFFSKEDKFSVRIEKLKELI